MTEVSPADSLMVLALYENGVRQGYLYRVSTGSGIYRKHQFMLVPDRYDASQFITKEAALDMLARARTAYPSTHTVIEIE